MTSALIVSTARTPLAKSWKGAFNMTHGATLGGHAVEHAIRRAGIDAAEVEAHLHVPPGDPLSYTEEFLDDRVGLFDLALKSQFLAARTFTEAMANAADTLSHPLQKEDGGKTKENKKAA